MYAIDFLWLAVPAYIVVQVVVLMWSSGWSRIVAALPLLAMIPIGVITVIALAQGSNMWPFLLLLASPVALLYVVIVAFFVRPAGKRSPSAT